MPVTVNECFISDEMIEREAALHEGSHEPRTAAACALAVRALLLDRARALDIAGEEDPADDAGCDAIVERLLEREAPVPQPTEQECRTYYESHREEFRSGELVEAAHILLAVMPN